LLFLILKNVLLYSEGLLFCILKGAFFALKSALLILERLLFGILKGASFVFEKCSFYSERLLFLLCHVDKVRYVLRSFTYVLQPRTNGVDAPHLWS